MRMPIDRRKLLIGLAAAMGGALSAGAARALDAALDFNPDGDFKTLDHNELALARAIMDTILPQTGTTSASGAGVDRFLDHMIAGVLSPAEGQALTAFLAAFQAKHPDFLTADAKARHKALAAVDRKLQTDDAFHKSYKSLKELVLIGYYTSETGATQELAYDPVPGPFHIVPVSEFGRNWAS